MAAQSAICKTLQDTSCIFNMYDGGPDWEEEGCPIATLKWHTMAWVFMIFVSLKPHEGVLRSPESACFTTLVWCAING